MCSTLMETGFRYSADDDLVVDSLNAWISFGFRIIHGYRQQLLAIITRILSELSTICASHSHGHGSCLATARFVASSQLMRLHFVNNMNVAVNSRYQTASI